MSPVFGLSLDCLLLTMFCSWVSPPVPLYLNYFSKHEVSLRFHSSCIFPRKQNKITNSPWAGFQFWSNNSALLYWGSADKWFKFMLTGEWHGVVDSVKTACYVFWGHEKHQCGVCSVSQLPVCVSNEHFLLQGNTNTISSVNLVLILSLCRHHFCFLSPLCSLIKSFF